MTTLNVRWEPAEGRVKEYKVLYVPAAGGAEMVVECPPRSLRRSPAASPSGLKAAHLCPFNQTGKGVCRNLQHHPAQPAARHRLHRVCGARLR